MSESQAILLVEDDVPIQNLIATALAMQDYDYALASDGKSALQEFTTRKFSVVLIDLGLPDMDGVELIKRIREWSTVPIIVISARSENSDKIQALDAGGDDYLTKPFEVTEMLARVRAAIRRGSYLHEKSIDEADIFVNGDLVIDYTAGVVKVGGQQIHLMPMEYGILCLLAKNVGKVLTHNYILEKVWVKALESDLASLRVYVASLRKKLNQKGRQDGLIQTHVGIGYRMIKTD